MDYLHPEALCILFAAVATIGLFSFLAVSTWSASRAAERQSYYKNDMLKKLSDSESGDDKVLQYLQEERDAEEKKRKEQGLTGGLIMIAVGVGTMIFLYGLLPGTAIYLCGTVPLLIGVALVGIAVRRHT